MSEAMTELKVRKALKDHKAIPVVRRAHPARKAISVHKVPQEVTVPKAHKAHKARQATTAHKVPKAMTAPRVRKALKVIQGVRPARKGIRVHKVRREVTGPKAHKDPQAMTAHKVRKDRKPLQSPTSISTAPISLSTHPPARVLVRSM
jgi:hypothetical protein